MSHLEYVPATISELFFGMVQADKNAGLARESVLLEGKCQLKAALSSALESKAEVEAALQTARLDQQRLQLEVCATPLAPGHAPGFPRLLPIANLDVQDNSSKRLSVNTFAAHKCCCWKHLLTRRFRRLVVMHKRCISNILPLGF